MKVPLTNDFNKALKHFLSFSDNFLDLMDGRIMTFEGCIKQVTEYNEIHPYEHQQSTREYERKVKKYERMRSYYQFMVDFAIENYRVPSFSRDLEFEMKNGKTKDYILNGSGCKKSALVECKEKSSQPVVSQGVGKGWRKDGAYLKKIKYGIHSDAQISDRFIEKMRLDFPDITDSEIIKSWHSKTSFTAPLPVSIPVESPAALRIRLKKEFFERRAKDFAKMQGKQKQKNATSIKAGWSKQVA